ncbi:MAG: class I SAM-dependent methyltransferase [Bacteroidetes bacterium]|nr:class I SAM-dependent methyltransferase [Bacteroidota bacterium]
MKESVKKSMEERFRSSIQKALKELGPDGFACWFDCGAGETNPIPKIQDAEYAFRSGFKDFFFSITRYPVPRYLKNPEEKVGLEIGSGGGRLVYAASYIMKKVIGIDIHPCQAMVKEMINARGVENVELYETDGKTLPVSDQSVDFIWSFIVFVHLSSFEVLESYIEEAFRVLKPGGIASFYYGKPYSNRIRTSRNIIKKTFYFLVEPIAELILLDVPKSGYRSFPDAPANSVCLMVTRRKMRSLVRKKGFKILGQQSNWNWTQAHIVLQKPDVNQ